jgi:hypothetical protein
MKKPSKFLSHTFLRELQENYYVSPRGIEYQASEVDFLLMQKRIRKSDLEARRKYIEGNSPDGTLHIEFTDRNIRGQWVNSERYSTGSRKIHARRAKRCRMGRFQSPRVERQA